MLPLPTWLSAGLVISAFERAGLRRLPLHAVSMRDPLQEALAPSAALTITIHDATCAARSRQLALPLATAGKSLAHRLEGSPFEVRRSGE